MPPSKSLEGELFIAQLRGILKRCQPSNMVDKQCSWCGRDTANAIFPSIQVILAIITLGYVYIYLGYKKGREEVERQNRQTREAQEREGRQTREAQEREERRRREEEERSQRERREKQEGQERQSREAQEREERQSRREQERLEREERDKIADILCSEYTTIEDEGILKRIRKAKTDFEGTLFWKLEDVKITGLDVLRYMCHPDNYERCQTKKLKELRQDLDAIVRMFQTFRIKLLLRGNCSENIKEEFGPRISELGEMTVPFVTGRKRRTISKVLEYFSGEPLVLEETNIEANIPYIRDHLRFGDPDPGHAQHEGYANTKFKLTFSFTQPGKMELPKLRNGEFHLQNTEMVEVNIDDLAHDIEQLWRQGNIFAGYASPSREIPNVYVLNAVRLFYYLICKTNGSSIQSGQEFLELIDNMTRIPIGRTDGLIQKELCLRHMSDIRNLLEMLAQSNLLEEQATAQVLNETYENLRGQIANLMQR